jgi:hypothetical protein
MLSPQGDWRERSTGTKIRLCLTDHYEEAIGCPPQPFPPRITHIGCRPITPPGRNISITMEHYEIRLRRHLGALMLAAFPSWSAEICGSDTILRGPIRDRAALHGVLAQVESFGLELIELRRLPAKAIGLPDTGDAELPRAKKGFDHE